MKVSNAMIVTGLFTILAIVIANVIATEYRIKREAKEEEKKLSSAEFTCPACPVCG